MNLKTIDNIYLHFCSETIFRHPIHIYIYIISRKLNCNIHSQLLTYNLYSDMYLYIRYINVVYASFLHGSVNLFLDNQK